MKKTLSAMLLMLMLLWSILPAASGDTITINGLEYQLSNPENFTDLAMVERNANDFYETLEAYPDIPTYVYLVNSSRTVDLLEDVSAVPVVYQAIQGFFSKSTTDYLRLDSLEQYAEYFYTTDHHWNYKGSYAGYCQVIRMLLGEEEPVLEPEETVTFPVKFNGSMNNRQRSGSSDEAFTVYRFNFPEMKITVNGVRQATYGNQEIYFAGKYSKLANMNHYAKFYGGDYGLLHIETEKTDRGNLILFANSFSNPINLLMASHFHNTWIIDFRYYLPEQNKGFHLRDLLGDGNVQVLILGDGLYFTQYHPFQKLL